MVRCDDRFPSANTPSTNPIRPAPAHVHSHKKLSAEPHRFHYMNDIWFLESDGLKTDPVIMGNTYEVTNSLQKQWTQKIELEARIQDKWNPDGSYERISLIFSLQGGH